MTNPDGLPQKWLSQCSFFGASLMPLLMAILFSGLPYVASAQAAPTPKAEKPAISEKSVDTIDADRYCSNISNLASEQRYAWQLHNLIRLQKDIDERVAELEGLRADVQDWISKRDKALNEAKEHIIAVYERMRPEAAAERLASIDDQVAIALLSKMKPRFVSAILNEMDAGKASDLTQEMASLVQVKTGDQEQ
nr:MotE family protein [uncultured Cohaesibacter sp.]